MTETALSCQELVELVTDYLEDALPPPERARLDAHIRDCDGCTIVVKGGSTDSHSSLPSQPTRSTSCGSRRPISRSARWAQIAKSSVKHISASGQP